MATETTPAEVGLSDLLGRDAQTLRALDGLHIALLDEEERAAFARMRAAGLARVEYSGAAGWLGLGRLRLVRAA